MEAHQADEDHRDGVWAIVDTDVSKLSGKAKRVNITMPARVLAIVDQAGVREGESGRGFLHARRLAMSSVVRLRI